METMYEACKLMQNDAIVGMEYLLDIASKNIEQLSDSQMWQQATARNDSIGNIVLHIVDNFKEWILYRLSKLSSNGDVLVDISFSKTKKKKDIIDLLEKTIKMSCKIIGNIPAENIYKKIILKNDEVTIGDAVLMTISHMDIHVGQIQRIAEDILKDS